MAEKKFTQPPNAQTHFSAVPAAEIERSRFDRSHAYKTTFDAGPLVPVYLDEVLPGDTFDLKATAFARLATPLKPVMDNMYLDVHFFFVPYRLVWDEFQEFMGERKNPNDDPSLLTVPRTSVKLNRPVGDIADYFGLPRNEAAPTDSIVHVSALPFRAYYQIYNDWYRDQNFIAEQAINYSSDETPVGQGALKYRLKRHDYFCSALPWPQKGDPVFIPIASSADVVTNSLPVTLRGVTDNTERNLQVSFPNSTNTVSYSGAGISAAQNVKWGNETGLQVDLTNATAVTINDLRTAFQIQKLLERDARGGSRYIEIILSHFGVHSDDARLQRPEYLGGGTQMINISPIAVTATTTDSIQGELTGFGTVITKGGFKKSFTEHGIVMGIVSARADMTYQNGVERFWSRKTRYDFYWPALSHLGEQEILNKEIFAQGSATGDSTQDLGIWGYQERYAEYRYKPSRITGRFASSDSTSLDVWHLAQDFDTLPALNGFFLVENPPIDRIIAVPGEPHFLLDMWFDLKCDRPMPVYSVPGLIDHF